MNEFHRPQSKNSIERARRARRSKFMRRFVTPLAIAGAAGGGTVAYVTSHDGDSYHPRTTVVHAGDTLSEIANEELQRQGDAYPTTQEINAYDQKIAEANPDKVTGSGASASAAIGEVLTLPKK
jgi:hypothetical protein